MMIPNKFNGYNMDGRRQYHKGGDGGAAAAQQQEADRQKRITQSVNTINSMFDDKQVFDSKAYLAANPDVAANQAYGNNAYGHFLDWGQKEGRQAPYTAIEKPRAQLYAEQKDAVYDINKRDVDKQYQQAERANRFGLARSGLLGGSADVDSNAQLQEKTNEGLMKAVGIADQAAADLKTQDERSRQSLISMAQSGIDTGTAQQMAMRQLDATAQNASGARQGASIGGLFDGLSQAYLARQYANGVKTGSTQGNQWYGVSSPQQTYAGQVS